MEVSEAGDTPAQDSTHIHDLPRDVLLEVLSRVSPSDLVQSASGVCRAWRELSADPGAWRSRRLRVSPRPHRPLSRAERTVLRRAPCLRALAVSLRRARDLPAPLSQLLPACRRLRELRLALPSLQQDMAADVRRQWPRLEHLALDAVSVNDAALEEVAQMQGLSHLEVSTFQEGVWSQLRLVAGCPELRSLKVDARCRETDEVGPADVVKAVGGHLLELGFGTLVVATHELFAAIGKCCRLQSLYVEDCSALTDAGLLELSQLGLRSLTLRNACNLTSEGLRRFLLCTDLSQLQFFHLAGCPAMTNGVLRLLASRCPHRPTVVTKDCPRVSQYCIDELWSPKSPESANATAMSPIVTPSLCGALVSPLRFSRTYPLSSLRVV